MVACYRCRHSLTGQPEFALRNCHKARGGASGDRPLARPAPLLQGSQSSCAWGWGRLGPDGLCGPGGLTRLSVGQGSCDLTGRGRVLTR